MTLWAASVDASNQLAQLRINTDGRFSMNIPDRGVLFLTEEPVSYDEIDWQDRETPLLGVE